MLELPQLRSTQQVSQLAVLHHPVQESLGYLHKNPLWLHGPIRKSVQFRQQLHPGQKRRLFSLLQEHRGLTDVEGSNR